MPWLILFSLCIGLFSINSNAQDRPLEQLLKLEIASYQLSSAFSAYVLFTGTPKFSERLASTVQSLQPIITRAKSSYPNIADKLRASLNYIEEKKELVYSPDDHRLIIGLATYQNPLYQVIKDKKHTLLKKNAKTAEHLTSFNESLLTQISFERVLAQYIALSASSAGFVVSDVSIEDNVNAFSTSLNNMSNQGREHQRLKVKWRFIKSNMLKNPGETSPYITMRTAEDIRKLLTSIYQDTRLSDSRF